jgi:hypothetical protein
MAWAWNVVLALEQPVASSVPECSLVFMLRRGVFTFVGPRAHSGCSVLLFEPLLSAAEVLVFN